MGLILCCKYNFIRAASALVLYRELVLLHENVIVLFVWVVIIYLLDADGN